MTKLYVCEISDLIKEVKEDSKALENYFDKLGKLRIEHILKNHKAEDRARALGASYLLLFALEREGITPEKLPDFAYMGNGKPYLKEYPDVYFNLSHTNNIIACVISNGEIGVDVEHVREIREATIRRVFSEIERETAKTNKREYIRLWAMKESCAKLTGAGLSDILEGMEIVESSSGIYVKKLKQDIRKVPCYKIIAEGLITDSYEYPYYYSVCVMKEDESTLECSDIQMDKYYWNNGELQNIANR